MENLQILKTCPWISNIVDVKDYFEHYNKILDDNSGMRSHNAEFNKNQTLREFFQKPDDLSMAGSRRTTPASFKRSSSSTDARREKSLKSPDEGQPLQSGTSAMDAQSLPTSPTGESLEDPFSIKELEESCSIDQLTVEGELPARELCQSNANAHTGRITNWYAGSFVDGVIPDGGTEVLSTLMAQQKELYKRETVKDYSRLRHRLFKYSSTFRMVMKEEGHPEDVPLEEGITKACLREVIFNIRVQRPYYKHTLNVKVINKFPKHSQEFLMLGSQDLGQLKDAIVCINDHYIHSDMSQNPDPTILQDALSLKTLLPSSHFYFNGCFYYDDRPPARDVTATIRNWASKTPNIGHIDLKPMTSSKLIDLKVRIGYPYLYQHLGNCEHLITITDVRLMHRSDIQDPSRYPLSRGNPLRIAVSCCACNLYKACWLVKDHPKLAHPFSHFCDFCLKEFCYGENMKKLHNFKLYSYVDELSAQKRMSDKQEAPQFPFSRVRVEIKGNLY